MFCKKYLSLLAAVFVDFVTKSDSARILTVFPVPLISHQKYFAIAVNALSNSGNHVTVLSTHTDVFNKRNIQSNVTLIQNEELNVDIRAKVDSYLQQWLVLNRIQQYKLKRQLIEFIYTRTMRVLDQRDQTENFDLVILESSADMLLELPHKLNLPVVMISSIPPQSYDRFFGQSAQPIYYPETYWFLTDTSTIWGIIKLLYIVVTDDIANSYLNNCKNMLYKHDRNGIKADHNELRSNVDLLFLNANHFWDGNRPLPPGLVFIEDLKHQGPEQISQDLKSYMDMSQNGVIYISFGTTFNTNTMMNPKTMHVFQTMFSKLNYDVIWKWDDGDMIGKPNNVRIEKWLPQKYVLGHPKLKLFITHGGAHSTSEAIEAGVPMVAIPVFGDQFYNARRVEQLGIGKPLQLMSLTESNLNETIGEILGDPSFQSNSQLLKSLWNDKPHTQEQKFLWWTEYVIRHKGASHLLSLAKNVSFYDYLVLDLVLALLVSSFAFVFSLVVFVRVVKRKVFAMFRRRDSLKMFNKRM